mmetsp:Transcript_43339/g.44038  ORF Transcript_43339/g.44038 Transcript_43339/m.44038 type:complete len:84 (-) Transcript_43339:338-589(-)
MHAFQKLAGKLQHASFGIPGGKGFSPIYKAISRSPPFVTITLILKNHHPSSSHIIYTYAIVGTQLPGLPTIHQRLRSRLRRSP